MLLAPSRFQMMIRETFIVCVNIQGYEASVSPPKNSASKRYYCEPRALLELAPRCDLEN